jgi:hypothetical protein
MGETWFGQVSGGRAGFPVGMGASEVLKSKSGRFVKNDGSGRAEVAGDGDASLMGFVESGDITCSSTEAGTTLWCVNDVSATFKVPFAYAAATYTTNYSRALMNTFVDLVVSSNIQFVNLTTSDDDLVKVVGGQAASAVATPPAYNDGYVLVMLNPAILDD